MFLLEMKRGGLSLFFLPLVAPVAEQIISQPSRFLNNVSLLFTKEALHQEVLLKILSVCSNEIFFTLLPK